MYLEYQSIDGIENQFRSKLHYSGTEADAASSAAAAGGTGHINDAALALVVKRAISQAIKAKTFATAGTACFPFGSTTGTRIGGIVRRTCAAQNGVTGGVGSCLAAMTAFVIQTAILVMAVFFTSQFPGGIALCFPAPIGSVTAAILVEHLANVIGVVVAKHTVALQFPIQHKAGIPSAA